MTNKEILDALAKITSARRGSVTEQWYDVTLRDGSTKKQGPYFVLTWYVEGKKKTARIPSTDIDEVRAQLHAGDEVKSLINQLWCNLEETAQKKTKQKPITSTKLAQRYQKH